jgi:hypothetical protein
VGGGRVRKGRGKGEKEEGGTERFWGGFFLLYVWCFALPLFDIFLVEKYGA